MREIKRDNFDILHQKYLVRTHWNGIAEAISVDAYKICYGETITKNILQFHLNKHLPVSILHKSIACRYRPVRVADGPITARGRFIKNASWEFSEAIKYWEK